MFPVPGSCDDPAAVVILNLGVRVAELGQNTAGMFSQLRGETLRLQPGSAQANQRAELQEFAVNGVLTADGNAGALHRGITEGRDPASEGHFSTQTTACLEAGYEFVGLQTAR